MISGAARLQSVMRAARGGLSVLSPVAGARVFGVLAGIIVAAASARVLGPAGFATFSLAQSLSTVAGLMTDFGLSPLLVRQINSRNTENVIATTSVLRTAIGTLAGLIAIALAALVTHSLSDFIACAIILVTAPAAGLTTGLTVALAELRTWRYAALIAAQSALWLVVALMLAYARANLQVWSLGFAASSLLFGLVVRAQQSSCTIVAGRFDLGLARGLLDEAYRIGLASLALTACTRLIYAQVYAHADPMDAAQFAVSLRLLEQGLVLPMTVALVGVPSFARAYSSGAKLSIHALKLVGASGLAALAVMIVVLLEPRILVSLAFGSGFIGAEGMVRLTIVGIVPATLAYALLEIAVIVRATRALWLFALALTALGQGATFVAIVLDGVKGAAIAIIASYVFATLYLFRTIRRARRNGRHVQGACGVAVSCI